MKFSVRNKTQKENQMQILELKAQYQFSKALDGLNQQKKEGKEKNLVNMKVEQQNYSPVKNRASK